MPVSHSQGKDVALDWYRQIAPTAVIDIGPGSGTYAKLMRTDPDAEAQRIWTAVEAWEPYIAEYGLEDLYDQVFVGDARDVGPWGFDTGLVIFGDVLEHMTQAEARKVLATAKAHAANIIVSIPVLHLDQDDANGNPYERHIDHWSYEQMREELYDGLVKTWCGDVLAYFWYSAEVARKRMGLVERGESFAGASSQPGGCDVTASNYGDAFAEHADADTIAHEIGCLILELEQITSTLKWMRQLQITRAEQSPAERMGQ